MYLLALEYHTSNVSQSASSPFFRKRKNRKEEIKEEGQMKLGDKIYYTGDCANIEGGENEICL
jgi:hypothetical protein